MTARDDEVTDVGTVDMGYHYPLTGNTLVMGGFDRDGVFDLVGFAGFQACFTGDGPVEVPPCCRIFDFEPDGDVDLSDFQQMSLAIEA